MALVTWARSGETGGTNEIREDHVFTRLCILGSDLKSAYGHAS